MAMIKDDGTPWGGPGFTFDKPQGQWPTETAHRPAGPVEDISSAIAQTLKHANFDLLSEEGTGEELYAGGNTEEKI